jgi:hypothetical protein
MIVNRIKQIIEFKAISTRQFCIKVGIANGFFDKVKDVGADKVVKILKTFPDVNPIWLLMGVGEMLLTEPSEQDIPSNGSPSVESLLNIIAEKDRQIAEKDAQIKRLFDLIDDMRTK